MSSTSVLATVSPQDLTGYLLAVLQGQAPGSETVITEGLDAEMAQAMEEDYDDVRTRLARIQLKNGAYQNRDTEQRETELRGIVLGKLNSQCLFPPGDDDQSEWAQGERAFWGGVPYICRTPNVKRPPEINPDLSPEQREEIMRRRNGAQSCETCPLAKPSPDGHGGWNAPDCNGSYELIWWDAKLQDYVWIRCSGASVPNLREAFSRTKRLGWFGQFPAKLGTEERKKGIKTFHPATLEFFPKEKFHVSVTELLLKKRRELMPAVESRVTADNHAGAHAEPAGPAASDLPLVEEPAEEPAPKPAAPPRARGLRLGPDGQPLLAGEPAPSSSEEVIPPPGDEDAPPPHPRASSRAALLGGDDDF